MKTKMFVIYDSKAAAYLQPWFLTTEGQATRVMTDCCNDKEHNFGRHPEDYTLFEIGSFNDQDARIEWDAPRSIGNGIEYVAQKIGQETQEDFFEVRGPAAAEPLNQNKQPTVNGEET